MGRVLFGTSGWSYLEWVGVFYESPNRMLSQYIKLFHTVEMDSSFYSMPDKNVIRGLTRVLPLGFKLSLKMPSSVTHKSLLGLKGDVTGTLHPFLEIIKPLINANLLGAVLIQLPPKLEYDLALLKSFLELLDHRYRYAIEFRHPSWLKDDVKEVLNDHNIAYTIVDEPLLPPETWVTADFSYIRWHGHGRRIWYNYRYNIEELRSWTPRVREIADVTDIVYGYFNNHYHGYAVENCLEIMEMFGLLDKEKREVLERVKSRIEAGIQAAHVRHKIRLSEIDDMDLNALLLMLSDRGRYRRGLGISPLEASFNIEGSIVSGKVREYNVLIDSDEKIIMHDCADWMRVMRELKLCKHLVRVISLLPRDRALRIARDLAINKEEWSFKVYT